MVLSTTAVIGHDRTTKTETTTVRSDGLTVSAETVRNRYQRAAKGRERERSRVLDLF